MSDQNIQSASRSLEAPQRRADFARLPTKPSRGIEPAGNERRRRGMSGLDAVAFEIGNEGAHGAQTDALMQVTSSASMQVAQRGPHLQECESMTTADLIRAWLSDTMAATGLTVKAWAQKSGVAASTIHRALKPGYEFVTSSRTLSRLAAAANVAPPNAAGVDVQLVRADFLPIRYDVGAGVWQELSDSQVFLGTGTVAPDPAYSGFPQWLERVQGDSMDREYRPGELVHVVDAIALGYAPQHGDHVVLVRRRNNGQEIERTLKEVVRQPGGVIEFWPRSTNPRWASPIAMVDGVTPSETTEVEVAGLVIGSYRPRR